ncbi:MAG: SIS domain-containing protein [Gammaproteobacteria bacterium]|nr:SIS domain-containing protein [Gammaproteobacteria bacterium]
MNQQTLLAGPDAAPPEVVARLLETLPELSPQLRKAARFVLDHPREVGVSSISELAEAAGVKPNTLVRMARAVGFEGYESFRAPFRDFIRKGRADFPERARWLQDLARGGRHGELLSEMAGAALFNIETLFAGVSAESVRAAADRIVDARVTYVLGVGVAQALTRNFAYLAGMALETVVAIPKDSSLPVDDLVRAGEDDVLIAVTFAPYRTEVVQAARVAVEQGVTVIAITDSVASTIAQGAAHVFCVPTHSAQFFTSTVALAALFETLMAFVVADAQDEVVARIERFHRHRREIGAYWDQDTRA